MPDDGGDVADQQSPIPPIGDTRLTVHTLVREDIFAGFMGNNLEKMPVHFKGEVLAGLTQSAQRTGRTDEAALHLDRMLTVLAGTRYEPMAQQWKADPSSAATSNLTCKNCHNPGRLAARLQALNKGQ
jgi:hypothetical protein